MKENIKENVKDRIFKNFCYIWGSLHGDYLEHQSIHCE